MRRALARWRARTHHLREQWTTWRQQWAVERDLERAIEGTGADSRRSVAVGSRLRSALLGAVPPVGQGRVSPSSRADRRHVARRDGQLVPRYLAAVHRSAGLCVAAGARGAGLGRRAEAARGVGARSTADRAGVDSRRTGGRDQRAAPVADVPLVRALLVGPRNAWPSSSATRATSGSNRPTSAFP